MLDQELISQAANRGLRYFEGLPPGATLTFNRNGERGRNEEAQNFFRVMSDPKRPLLVREIPHVLQIIFDQAKEVGSGDLDNSLPDILILKRSNDCALEGKKTGGRVYTCG